MKFIILSIFFNLLLVNSLIAQVEQVSHTKLPRSLSSVDAYKLLGDRFLTCSLDKSYSKKEATKVNLEIRNEQLNTISNDYA